jgi:hypothetical protein
MDEITYTAEQREALKAANLTTNRVPLYYHHGRLSKAAIQGLIEHGVLVQAGAVNQLMVTDVGLEEARRLLAADVIPGF